MGGNNSKKAKKDTSPPPSVKNVQTVNKMTKEQEDTTTTKERKRGSSVFVQEDDTKFSLTRVDKLFDRYKEDENSMSIQGIERFCKDLNVDTESALVLVLAWHMKAQTMGIFTREEFKTGLTDLNADSLEKLKEQFKNMERELTDPVKFKEIYKFAFVFAKEKDQKSLSVDMAKELLRLLVGDRFSHTKNFIEFLSQASFKAINADQWQNFLEFNKAIASDLHNYDENGAWPVMFDEFVEYVRNKKNQENNAV
jgi:DCN1-like protein 4/5